MKRSTTEAPFEASPQSGLLPAANNDVMNKANRPAGQRLMG
jgi:hypothetical protein